MYLIYNNRVIPARDLSEAGNPLSPVDLTLIPTDPSAPLPAAEALSYMRSHIPGAATVYNIGNLRVSPGLMIVFGGSGSGKNWLMDQISSIPYTKWNEMGSHPADDNLPALLSILGDHIWNHKNLKIDSFKKLPIMFTGALGKGGVGRESLLFLESLNSLAYFYDILIIAAFNPLETNVDVVSAWVQALKGVANSMIITDGVGRQYFTARDTLLLPGTEQRSWLHIDPAKQFKVGDSFSDAALIGSLGSSDWSKATYDPSCAAQRTISQVSFKDTEIPAGQVKNSITTPPEENSPFSDLMNILED